MMWGGGPFEQKPFWLEMARPILLGLFVIACFFVSVGGIAVSSREWLQEGNSGRWVNPPREVAIVAEDDGFWFHSVRDGTHVGIHQQVGSVENEQAEKMIEDGAILRFQSSGERCGVSSSCDDSQFLLDDFWSLFDILMKHVHDRAVVRSPVDGILIKSRPDGSYARFGSPVASVVSQDDYRIVVRLPNTARRGDEVRVFWPFLHLKSTGRIVEFSPSGDSIVLPGEDFRNWKDEQKAEAFRTPVQVFVASTKEGLLKYLLSPMFSRLEKTHS